MEKRARFLITLQLGQADRVPVFDFFESQNLFYELTGIRPVDYDARLAIKCAFRLGVDAVWIPFSAGSSITTTSKNPASDIYKDEWGTTYKRTPYSWPNDAPVDYPLKKERDLLNFVVPDPTIPNRLDGIEIGCKLAKGKIAVVGSIFGPFTIAYLTMGLHTLSLSVYDNPRFFCEVLRLANEFLIEAAKRIMTTRVDAICIAEDLGFHSGTFISPYHFKKFILPYLAELVSTIRRNNMPVILHSDGNLNAILDYLVDMGINGLNPIESDAHMNLGAIKRKYGKKICLIGGVYNGILSRGTPEDVEKETIGCLQKAARDGGYVIGSDSGDLLDNMPMENIKAMIAATKKYGVF